MFLRVATALKLVKPVLFQLLKRVFEKKKKGILIYPFVSLAREKMNTLKVGRVSVLE